MSDRILIGVIVGAHGVRGEVKIKSFTAAARDVAAYGPVTDEAGNRPLKLKVVGQAKGVVVARIDGVADRNAAEALKGLRLYVARAALPSAAVLLGGLFIVTYVPFFSLALLGGG